MFYYMKANRTAGYSGFVLYVHPTSVNPADRCVWMVPGTFFDDWDNRF